MLILTRKKRQRINIFHKGDELTLMIYDISPKFDTVKLGFIAEKDKEFIILREEVKKTIIKPIFNQQDVVK